MGKTSTHRNQAGPEKMAADYRGEDSTVKAPRPLAGRMHLLHLEMLRSKARGKQAAWRRIPDVHGGPEVRRFLGRGRGEDPPGRPEGEGEAGPGPPGGGGGLRHGGHHG